MPSRNRERRRIGLALSGGGVRAAAFHAGVLRWLAEHGRMEEVEHVSTVSGGSLFIGLVFHFSGYLWPSSTQYHEIVLPRIRQILTSKSLQCDALFRLIFIPCNWRFILSRANVVSKSIERCWGIDAKLSDLSPTPVWTINGTTAENGRRFRFKNRTMGDYKLGYADAADFKLADAMAVSAAFPVGIGPLKIDTRKRPWYSRDSRLHVSSEESYKLKFGFLHLYDGGVYDNLGLEPLFDMGKQRFKNDEQSPLIDAVIVSDAASPFSECPIPGPLHPGRLVRVVRVAFDQTRALRVRSFVTFLQNSPFSGMYLQIGSDPRKKLATYSQNDHFGYYDWMGSDMILKAVSYKTTLSRMSMEYFDLIERHGYETALWNDLAFDCLQMKAPGEGESMPAGIVS
ncbi:MAG: patatin-like phospholipase family protein [Thermodesulfovibrionales bacterium]